MPKVRVACFGLTLDGFSAGADQSLQNPLGLHGPEMMSWFFPTDVFQKMYGTGSGETGVDNQMAIRSFDNVGAWILGRNMFGPVRGPWPDESWKGWWGDEPSYHAPTFILTHHARAPVEMKGGTTFYFVTGGIHEALERAREAAGGKDVRIGGGVSTVRQYLKERLIDELHIAIRPVLLGKGEALWQGLDARSLGYGLSETIAGERATHAIVKRT